MIKFVLLVNKQGQTRLSRYAVGARPPPALRAAFEGEVVRKCLTRSDKQCSFVDHRGFRIVYRRYASLFFLVGVDRGSVAGESGGAGGEDQDCGGGSADHDDAAGGENGLATLELIHALVETLDRHFGNVCELDLMFNLEAAHYVLDEMICAASGEVVETNKANVLQPLQLLERSAAAQGG